ncbi:ARMT1-like domain-containing protein [Nitratidesulfovibrio vulgaris]|uniref:ARMT1-like domain-containing protein n=1 Tax=Nitratidesulfovibrio vulgaris TaxID=881 RepID=UPI0013DF36F5|nr:ARMT1-like domain-containing protein [Nitratidesulfovibrio vulgaris]
MKRLPQFDAVSDIRLRKDPYLDAWVYNLMTENNIEHLLNPTLIATPEQLRFMVALDEDQIYMPCSDQTFSLLMQPEKTRELQEQYNRAWRIIMRIARTRSLERSVRRRIMQYCRHRFRLHINQHIIIPSRLVKRLTSIVLTQSGQEDPWAERKQQANRRAADLLDSFTVRRALRQVPDGFDTHGDIVDLRWRLDLAELQRLLYLANAGRAWIDTPPSPLDIEKEFATGCAASGSLGLLFGPETEPRKKVLYLCDPDGGGIFDVAVIKTLLRMGHQVVFALKEGFYFYAPRIWDHEHDPSLKSALEGAFVLHDNVVTKNDLLRHLREHRFVVISDGTRERTNLHRVSVTFARAWKECDVVIARGWRNHHTFGLSSHQFTRDIVMCWFDQKGQYHMECKPRAKGVRKFTEHDLLQKAEEIIQQMREARRAGRSVMFYSCIIGSVPGQTKTAIGVVDAFVRDLRERLDNTFIINPAEHFEEGMDGDDLMFMWERVQRSGLLDVWRFQTVEDIETSFALMGRKVPSAWSGKDSTFSTGCTKEMHIALDLQKKYRELQIIGPSPDKFFRRREYGVGKYFDVGISG